MEFIDVRKVFFCFDELDLKVRFKFILVRKLDKISLLNMFIIEYRNR